jgi:putative ABC transport system substrate-binding protein
MFLVSLVAKRLGLLHELLPTVNLVGVLNNPNLADARTELRDAEDAAQTLGLKLHVQNASTELEIETAFAAFDRESIRAILMLGDPFFVTVRARIAALAARYAMPAMYELREFAAAGGLMS